jgi:DNA-binding response OmpR family regulator
MPTVLVVEDERDIREVLRRYLERAGLSVLTTATGAEAIRFLMSSPPDLVILDLGLPDVDGTDVLREIHAAGRRPVLVLTARSTVDDRIHGLQLGADDYVTKPFSPAEVVLRVQAVLHRSGGQPFEGGPLTYGKGRAGYRRASARGVAGWPLA